MSYCIALTNSWKLYQPVALDGWNFLGVIRRETGAMGALAQSPVGVYVQLNAGVVRSLDQAEVQRALTACRR
jgi:hypothetical protein